MTRPALRRLEPRLVEPGPARSRPALLWSFDGDVIAVASGPLGGGIGVRRWVVNAEVDLDYARLDPEVGLLELGAALGCEGEGVGLLTAAPVREWTAGRDGEVEAAATVGLSLPTWAAADGAGSRPWAPGTINIVAWMPVPLVPAALVNAVATATEAKAQALAERGVSGTGTATDAVCILCPVDGDAEPFGGPRSTWGAPLARAVHAAVTEGVDGWNRRHG